MALSAPQYASRRAQEASERPPRGSLEAPGIQGLGSPARCLDSPKEPQEAPKTAPKMLQNCLPEPPQAFWAPRIGTATVRDSIYNPALVQSETALFYVLREPFSDDCDGDGDDVQDDWCFQETVPFYVLWEPFSGARKKMANDDDGECDGDGDDVQDDWCNPTRSHFTCSGNFFPEHVK